MSLLSKIAARFVAKADDQNMGYSRRGAVALYVACVVAFVVLTLLHLSRPWGYLLQIVPALMGADAMREAFGRKVRWLSLIGFLVVDVVVTWVYLRPHPR